MNKKFKFRGWSILGLINTYLGWKYNKIIVVAVEIKTKQVVKVWLEDADAYDERVKTK